jgi:hypothetical protein
MTQNTKVIYRQFNHYGEDLRIFIKTEPSPIYPKMNYQMNSRVRGVAIELPRFISGKYSVLIQKERRPNIQNDTRKVERISLTSEFYNGKSVHYRAFRELIIRCDMIAIYSS